MYTFTALPPLAGSGHANIMTVDVEDYFHVTAFARVVRRDEWEGLESRVAANTDRLIDLFAEYGVRGTFFVLGWVAERHPRLVRRIVACGHELASHSYWHRLVYDLTPAEFREDLRRARQVIEDIGGVQVRGFRAPSYSIVERSLWALEVLAEEGYAYDASVFPVHHDTYGVPTAPPVPHTVHLKAGTLLELPGTAARTIVGRVPIGGGYFRLLPYRATRWAIAHHCAVQQRPAVFYLHPWEIDPEQPRLPAPMKSRLRHYNNLDRTETRLRRLLQDFKWDSVAGTLLSPPDSIVNPTFTAPPPLVGVQ